MPMRVAFLGPEGTYGERAANSLMELESIENSELVACSGLRSVVEHVVDGRCEVAVVPVENSVEGGVTATLDALWSYSNLRIRRALVLPIRHALLSSGSLDDISEVLSHPQALAQCSSWLALHLPKAVQLPASSTAEAARMVRGSHFRAAIADRSVGEQEGLQELAYPVNDVSGNCTRFLLLEKGNGCLKGNIASVAFSLQKNAPGALIEALEAIAHLGLNMTRIESRPSKRELGEYVFFVDVELTDQLNVELLNDLTIRLKPLCEHLIHFGTYPSSVLE